MQTAQQIIEVGNAIRHAAYVANYGPAMPTARTMLNAERQHAPKCGPNRQSAPAKRPAFPDPFAAFDAAVNGKTAYVSGYARKDGRKVAGYYRRPRATWLGTINPIGAIAGTELAPLMIA